MEIIEIVCDTVDGEYFLRCFGRDSRKATPPMWAVIGLHEGRLGRGGGTEKMRERAGERKKNCASRELSPREFKFKQNIFYF
jgi:hypothetical protein